MYTKILTLVPKKVWLYLILLLAGAMVVGTAYTKGYESGVNKERIVSQEATQELLSKALTKVKEDLEKAVNKQKEGLKAVSKLNSTLNEVEKEKSKLKEELSDALNNPPTDCNTLDDRYYELYKKIYNTPRPD